MFKSFYIIHPILESESRCTKMLKLVYIVEKAIEHLKNTT